MTVGLALAPVAVIGMIVWASCAFAQDKKTDDLKPADPDAAVYQYEAKPGWGLQPNFQYIVHPGGGATNPLGPYAPALALHNATVFGLRTVVKF